MDLNQEKEMVFRAQRDPEAFGLLFDKYYQEIYGYILKRTINVQLTEDIVSETFFKALNNLKKFKWQAVPFSSWLYRIAINELNDHFRVSQKTSLSLNELQENSGFDIQSESNLEIELMEKQNELEKHQSFIQMHKKVKELPDIYQEVIALKYFEKKKISEIAEILNKKEGTIKSLLSRGIDKLKELM